MNPADVLQRFPELPFPVELELNGLTMTIREIFELREGSVLRTEHAAGEPFTLRVGGVELAAAEIVVMDDRLSARIKKLAEKPKAASGNGAN